MTITGGFNVPIYGCDVKIIISPTLKRSVNYYLRKHGEEKIEFEPAAFFFHPVNNPEKSIYYVFFDSDRLTTNELNHEKSHLVEEILKDRDIKPKDEVRAYLDGFISDKMDLFFKRRKGKIKHPSFSAIKKLKKAH
jgi:hypothetical protein